MFVKKCFLLLLMIVTMSTVMAQNEGAEGGFQFEEEKKLGAEGASGTDGGILSTEALNGSEGIIRASGANNGSEGSGNYDGGSLGSGEMIRSEGGTLGSDEQIFVRPVPGGDTGPSNPINNNGTGGTGGIDPGTGQENVSPEQPEGAVPVDGGLAILLLAGAGYGSKKAYEMRKKQKQVKSEK